MKKATTSTSSSPTTKTKARLSNSVTSTVSVNNNNNNSNTNNNSNNKQQQAQTPTTNLKPALKSTGVNATQGVGNNTNTNNSTNANNKKSGTNATSTPATSTTNLKSKQQNNSNNSNNKNEFKEQKTVTIERRDSALSFATHPDFIQPLEVKRVPDQQIQDLTPEQKAEVFTKVLSATNPKVSKATVYFNYAEGVFKPNTNLDHMAVHFSMDGSLIVSDSNEARAQAVDVATVSVAAVSTSTSTGTGTDTDTPDAPVPDTDGDGGDGGEAATNNNNNSTAVSAESKSGGAPILKNQFNFSERASQTFNNAKRDREVATEPPPCQEFGANVTQWEIFDTYLAELRKNIAAKAVKEQSKARHGGGKDEKEEPTLMTIPPSSQSRDKQIFESTHMARTMKLMERMVNQNAEADTFHEFKYYEHDADHVREDGKGDFSPLWRFAAAAAKKKTVTAVAWSPQYFDLFAVGYGSYDFAKQNSGVICIFTLKNTSYPEFTLTTDSGVMCLDWHPQHSSLLAVGLYDGTVCVYDVRNKSQKPIFVSSDPKVKHTDPVWQVHWEDQDPLTKNLNFFSVSSDGRVTNWIMRKNELTNEEVLQLKLVPKSEPENKSSAPTFSESGEIKQVDGVTTSSTTTNNNMNGNVASPSPTPFGDDDTPLVTLAGASCFDFNKRQAHLFVIGTEEGSIHCYSRAVSTQSTDHFDGHHMMVYNVRWNPFHPRIFLSCSADWTVKLWDQNVKKPLMIFDMNDSVAGVAWSPYSSTVFAAITSDGLLRVYDLNVNKHEPVGERRVVKKSKLTQVCFNPREPVILVGDDHGVVQSFKLSPNLRKMSTPRVDDINVDQEVNKLDRLLLLSDSNNTTPAVTGKK